MPPTIVLVHGAFAESSSWNPVIDLLAWSCGHTRDVVNKTVDSMSESEVEDFLDRIYTSGA